MSRVELRRRLVAAAAALSLLATAPSCRRRQSSPSPAPAPATKADSSHASLKIIYPGAPGSFVKLARKLSRAVVHLRADAPVRGGPADWFSAATTPQSPMEIAWAADLQRSVGSALAVDRQGHLLTNAHLVGARQHLKAKLPGGRTVTAAVLGRDARMDLALLKIDPKQLPKRFKPARIGSSQRLQAGEWLLLLSDPFGIGYRVTAGVVSATPRQEIPIAKHALWSFIQTDIAIHPGNSGGPVFNTVGEVIGIATAVKEEPQGIGFVVPIDAALKVMPMLRDHGKVVRAWVGIRIAPVTAELAAKVGLGKPRGALVQEVFPRGPADRSGLRRGDIVLSFDERAISDATQLPWLASLAGVGRAVIVKVWRAGKELTFTLSCEAMPE